MSPISRPMPITFTPILTDATARSVGYTSPNILTHVINMYYVIYQSFCVYGLHLSFFLLYIIRHVVTCRLSCGPMIYIIIYRLYRNSITRKDIQENGFQRHCSHRAMSAAEGIEHLARLLPSPPYPTVSVLDLTACL